MSDQNLEQRVSAALEAGEGLLRLAPNWVPRSFLMPGRRLKLHPNDYYALGTHRGGIDERWFASTTRAMNEGAPDDEGLSYVEHEGERFTLRAAVEAAGARIIGSELMDKYSRWPIYSKFFDNMGPIPHHLHQNNEQAALVGQQGKPESYYYPPQLNNVGNNFPYTFFGLEPGTTKEDVRRCLERWNEGDNGILDLSKAARLKPGTGWLVPPCILHAPGSLLTYEPQWGSDVFGMWQSMVEGRAVGWELLVKDVPAEKHQDLDFLISQLDWEGNVDPEFKANHYLEPVLADGGPEAGFEDKWVVYGQIGGESLFSAKELTVQPGARAVIKDHGASGLIAVQGRGTIGKLRLETPVMIRFGEMTADEVFITQAAAQGGIEVVNTGTEPLVTLRYFGPEQAPGVPEVGAYRRA
ncbi:MAG: phosphomannose isomerase [Arthrobacter sp.]|nr:phosphomannose isomerase [Arthrobacter sp.]